MGFNNLNNKQIGKMDELFVNSKFSFTSSQALLLEINNLNSNSVNGLGNKPIHSLAKFSSGVKMKVESKFGNNSSLSANFLSGKSDFSSKFISNTDLDLSLNSLDG